MSIQPTGGPRPVEDASEEIQAPAPQEAQAEAAGVKRGGAPLARGWAGAAAPQRVGEPARDAIPARSRQIIEDPLPVAYIADPGAIAVAREELRARAGDEAAAVAKLAPGDRAAYQRLQKAITGTEGSPGDHALAALQRLLLSGRLTGSRDLQAGKSLLTHLDALGTQPLASGITRTLIVRELVQELEKPLRMEQGGKGTCGATMAALMLAMENPAEYARLVADLAKPAGTATVKDGSALKRETDWMSAGPERTRTAQLLWPALMELANGAGWDYDNTADVNRQVGGGSEAPRPGLDAAEIAYLVGALTGRTYMPKSDSPDAVAEIERLTAAGKVVPAAVTTGSGGGHAVLITNVQDGHVFYANPHGQLEAISTTEFPNFLQNYAVPG